MVRSVLRALALGYVGEIVHRLDLDLKKNKTRF